MKILAIGNSFSDDAMRYLQKLGIHQGRTMKCVNLMIPGCSLRQHYLNILDDERKYRFMFNGEFTGIYVSVREALKSDDWDAVVLHQASPNSFDYDTFTPYLDVLADYVRKYSPKSRLYVNETWCYEQGSQRLADLGFRKSEEMLHGIRCAYRKAAKSIDAAGLIPSGEAMYLLSATDRVHRDTYHASFGVGRFVVAATWYMALTGEMLEGSFSMFPFDEPVSVEAVERALKAARKAIKDGVPV